MIAILDSCRIFASRIDMSFLSVSSTTFLIDDPSYRASDVEKKRKFTYEILLVDLRDLF